MGKHHTASAHPLYALSPFSHPDSVQGALLAMTWACSLDVLNLHDSSALYLRTLIAVMAV